MSLDISLRKNVGVVRIDFDGIIPIRSQIWRSHGQNLSEGIRVTGEYFIGADTNQWTC